MESNKRAPGRAVKVHLVLIYTLAFSNVLLVLALNFMVHKSSYCKCSLRWCQVRTFPLFTILTHPLQMRDYPLRYAGTDRIKKSHYNTGDCYCRPTPCICISSGRRFELDPVAASRGGWGIPPVGGSAPPPRQKKKMAKISHFRQFFGFLPPQKRILPPRCPPQKIFWCRHWLSLNDLPYTGCPVARNQSCKTMFVYDNCMNLHAHARWWDYHVAFATIMVGPIIMIYIGLLSQPVRRQRRLVLQYQ